MVTLLLAIGLIILFIFISKLLSWIKCVSNDLYDIKKHLKLPVMLLTKEKRHEEVIAFIDEWVKKGKDKKTILEAIDHLSVLDDFANPRFLGKLKVSAYEKYIALRIEQFKEHKTLP